MFFKVAITLFLLAVPFFIFGKTSPGAAVKTPGDWCAVICTILVLTSGLSGLIGTILKVWGL